MYQLLEKYRENKNKIISNDFKLSEKSSIFKNALKHSKFFKATKNILQILNID